VSLTLSRSFAPRARLMRPFATYHSSAGELCVQMCVGVCVLVLVCVRIYVCACVDVMVCVSLSLPYLP